MEPPPSAPPARDPAAAGSAHTQGFLALPRDLIESIFRAFPERVRLLVFALVCKKWRTIAVNTVTGLRLTTASMALPSWTHITSLALRLDNQPALSALHAFTRLETLQLDDLAPCALCHLVPGRRVGAPAAGAPSPCAPLAELRLPRLLSLSVTQCCVHTQEFVLQHAHSLTHLATAKLAPLGTEGAAASFARLRSLSWEYSTAGDPLTRALLGACSGLTELRLRLPDAALSAGQDTAAFASLPLMAALRRIELHGPYQPDAACALLERCPALSDLAYRPRGLQTERLALALFNTTLTELDISHRPTPAHYYMDALPLCPRLTKLVFAQSYMTADSVPTHWVEPVSLLKRQLREVFVPLLRDISGGAPFKAQLLASLTTLHTSLKSHEDVTAFSRLKLPNVTSLHLSTPSQMPLARSTELVRALLLHFPSLRLLDLQTISLRVYDAYTDEEVACVDSLLSALAAHGVTAVRWRNLTRGLGRERLRSMVYRHAWLDLEVSQ